MRRLPALLLALLAPGVVRADAPFPGGLLDSTGRTAYLTAGDGIAAVDLTTGAIRWRNAEATEPLLVAGDRLYALAGSRAGRLFVRGFDLSDRGQRVFESEPIELPRWAVPQNGPGRSFSFDSRRDRNRLELSWRIAAWADGSPRKQTSGSAAVDLLDGKVRQTEGRAPEAAARVPAYLEKLSVRWQHREAGQVRAVVLEELPGSSAFQRRQMLVLRRWDDRSGKELPSRELLRGRDLIVLPDVNGRHLWLRDRTTSAEVAARTDGQWHVVSAADGKEVARVAHAGGTLSATIHGKRAYFLTVSSVRTERGRVTSKGHALLAVELGTGQTAWRRPLAADR